MTSRGLHNCEIFADIEMFTSQYLYSLFMSTEFTGNRKFGIGWLQLQHTEQWAQVTKGIGLLDVVSEWV